MPAGYTINDEGRPYVINNPGYTPHDAYNPISIANYIQAINRGPGTAEQKRCAMVAAGEILVNGSVVDTYNGEVVRWLPYQFSFSANPSTPVLPPGWYSGLGQAGSMSALRMLYQATGDERWLTYAQELANALEVPYDEGGIKHYINVEGRRMLLWFEEYPTGDTPTTVLNGNNLVLIGLDMWADYTAELAEDGIFPYDERSAELFEEGLTAYEHVLPMLEVPTGGGIMSSYDLVRGYPAAPLRVVKLDDGRLDRVSLNGDLISMPVLDPAPTFPNRFLDPSFETSWQVIGPLSNTSIAGGVVTTTTTGTGWVGVAQNIPAGTFPAGRRVVVQFDARHEKAQAGVSAAPMASIQANCVSGNYQLARHTTVRGAEWATYSVEFPAPATDCQIRVQFLPTVSVVPGSTLQWSKPAIRLAEAKGAAHDPDYDILVFRTPRQELKLFGSGLYTVQAFADGRWQSIATLNATAWGRSVIIPERYTGRNLNYRYHESHIGELRQLASRSGWPVFAEYANRWVKTAINTPG